MLILSVIHFHILGALALSLLEAGDLSPRFEYLFYLFPPCKSTVMLPLLVLRAHLPLRGDESWHSDFDNWLCVPNLLTFKFSYTNSEFFTDAQSMKQLSDPATFHFLIHIVVLMSSHMRINATLQIHVKYIKVHTETPFKNTKSYLDISLLPQDFNISTFMINLS